MLRIAVDAMGGDAGAPAVVEGVARLSCRADNIHTLLVGHRDVLHSLLGQYRHDPSRIDVVHAPDFLPMGADPHEVLERRPGASIRVATDLVAAGEAEALVSAGPTGGTVLAATARIGRLPGIRRAALAAVYPTEKTHGPRGDPFALILDVGATLGATADDLVGFAVMGSAYARIISGNPSPKVALLSNGAEANKGTPAIVAAHARLREHPFIDFSGNIEGIDIVRGTADVVVCDGFLGNVVLKMLEGVAEVLSGLMREAFDERLLWRVGLSLVGHDIRQIKAMTDWKQYGGAPLLGLERVVIKAHGRSNPRAFANAVRVAARAVEGGLTEQIRLGLIESARTEPQLRPS